MAESSTDAFHPSTLGTRCAIVEVYGYMVPCMRHVSVFVTTGLEYVHLNAFDLDMKTAKIIRGKILCGLFSIIFFSGISARYERKRAQKERKRARKSPSSNQQNMQFCCCCWFIIALVIRLVLMIIDKLLLLCLYVRV